jgi:hypothetical protein
MKVIATRDDVHASDEPDELNPNPNGVRRGQ